MTMLQQPTPGYLVITQSVDHQPRLFTHADLLTARKAALTHVESIRYALEMKADQYFDVEVYLVETSPGEPTSIHHVTRILQRFHLNDSRAVGPHNTGLPTTPGEPIDWLKNLRNWQAEFDYYQQHQYRTGLGCFRIELGEDSDLLNSQHEFTVLYDALAAAMAEVGYYNEFYREPHQPGLHFVLYYDAYADFGEELATN